jgi:hypothetical protein
MSRPSSIEGLLGAVGAFLRNDLAPGLQGPTAFNARVCANAIDLVIRELQFRTEKEAAEHARLSALLYAQGTLDELRETLCQRIAAGELDESSPVLREHLWLTVMAQLQIDQPGYSTYRRKT